MEPALAVDPHDVRMLLALATVGLIALEYVLSRIARQDAYDLGEAGASLFIHAGHRLAGMATAGLVALPLDWIHGARLFDIPMGEPAAWCALFVGVEASYYLHHLAMHKLRWLWATHAVHHSATRLNLSAAVRISWFGPVTGGVVFYLPLVLLGFPPLAVLSMLAINLFYQLFLHTAWAPGLGPLEWVLNTPRHHHVHHASNAGCLDRNFGGILILFDRAFGTFAEAPAGEKLRFGLVGTSAPTRNPMTILLREWVRLLADLRGRKGIGGKLRVLVERP